MDVELTTYDGVLIDDSLFLSLPWSELALATDDSVPVPFLLDVTSDFGLVQCLSTSEMTLDVLENPEVSITSTDAICVGSVETLTAVHEPGTGQGGLTYAWSNEDNPEAFDIATPNAAVTDFEVHVDGVIPDAGSVLLTVTDQEGCVGVSPVSTITIHELPVLGDLTVLPDAVCSGTTFEVTLTGITVDGGLDSNDVQYTWSADLNGANLLVDGTGIECHHDSFHR